MEGVDLRVDVNYEHHPSEMRLINGELLRGEHWSGFLRSFIEGLPPEKRDPVLAGLTRCWLEYDDVERAIRFAPKRYLVLGYTGRSHIALIGTATTQGARCFLRLQYQGQSWVFAESVKVRMDDSVWQSERLEFFRDNDQSVWEYALLPLSDAEIRDLVEGIVSSNRVVVRFQGSQYYADLLVTQRMKDDLYAVLGAVDVLNN